MSKKMKEALRAINQKQIEQMSEEELEAAKGEGFSAVVGEFLKMLHQFDIVEDLEQIDPDVVLMVVGDLHEFFLEFAKETSVIIGSEFKAKSLKGKYRSATEDYSIKVDDASIYIKPQVRGLTITAHPSIEDRLSALIGEPTERDSPNSINYAKWVILK